MFQQGGEGEPLRSQSSREGPLSYTQPVRNFVSAGLSVRKQRNDRIFNGRLERLTMTATFREGFFTVVDQYVAEIRVGTDHRQVSNALCESHLVSSCAKRDFTAEKFGHFNEMLFPWVYQLDFL